MSLLRYRTVIYAGTVLTGLTGLVYQVVWQKYLSFLVGSESRSVSLVVAVFLAGLAAGYRTWGTLSERFVSRRKLLRLYGLIELGIGAYAALFPLYLQVVTAASQRAPAWMLTDLLLSVMTLLLPTFCMGATIPLLVSVVPEHADEVHLCHAKIYGINTLGACVGAFGASFFLIPRFGLPGTLLLASAVNLVVGTIFVLNPLRHGLAKDEPVEPIAHRFPLGAVYAYSLVTGTVTLSFEVLFVRVLGLTIGTGPHNFAIVVGVFILGLAIGSLLVSGRLLSVRVLFRALSFLILYLLVLFHSVPYWPYWLSNVRAALRSIPVNYTVYLLLVTGFLVIVLLPFLVPLGTMLPLTYALIPKSATDYGKKCGWLYFYNTIGTALGAIVVSYLLLTFLDLDQIFKLDVLLLAVLAVYLLQRERRRMFAAVIGVATLVFAIGPRWDRASHHVGLFRFATDNSFQFTGWFRKPDLAPEVVFFEDGPDSTVTVVQYPHGTQLVPVGGGEARPETLDSRSLVINGKTDGDTLSDLSTNTLAALLPYLHAPDRSNLRATVVGLGTGMTAGLLGVAEEIERVTAVEISSTLVEASPAFDPFDFDLSANAQVEIVAVDGFKYLARLDDKRDIIVSATSPPWVVGVENLFTPEFYRLVHDALADDGVFFQWFPLYAMDPSSFRAIVSNLMSVFPHGRLYQISFGEMGILVAQSPLPERPLTRRFLEPAISTARAKLRLDGVDQLMLIRLLDSEGLDFLVREGGARLHTLTRPGLAYDSDRIRFLNPTVDWDAFIDPRLARLTWYSEARREAFAATLSRHPGGLRCTLPTLGPRLFCDRYNSLWEADRLVALEPGQAPLTQQVEAYDRLRGHGVHPPDPAFLARIVKYALDHVESDPQAMGAALDAVLTQYEKDGMWEEAARDLSVLLERGVISPEYHRNVMRNFESGRRGREAFLKRYRGE